MAECLILAGGLGTRLREVEPNLPKCLVDVAGKPFIYHQLELLYSQGIDCFTISLGYKSGEVISVLRDNLFNKFDIRTISENAPLGTGGAIMNAFHHFRIHDSIVVNGDTLFNGSLASLISSDDGDSILLDMLVIPAENVGRFGSVNYSSDGLVTGFSEKSETGSGLINAGFYRVREACFDGVSEKSFSFETLISILSRRRLVRAIMSSGDFVDIGVPHDLQFLRTAVLRFAPQALRVIV